MKKTLIVLTLLTASLSSFAQYSSLGVGTGAPTDAYLEVFSHLDNGAPELKPELKIFRQVLASPEPNINFIELWNYPLTGPTTLYDVFNKSGYLGILQPNPSQALDVNGNAYIENAAIIGSSYTTGSAVALTTPGLSTHEYSLYVANGILTEKVKVSLSNTSNWSDFVFKKDYSLMPIKKLAEYINANQHLPEIPSATEVVKNGVDLASMDAKLLQKIEELTLYVIQQQKQLEQQKSEIEILKKKVD